MLFSSFYGNPDAQPVVFLHGFLGSHLDFLPMIQILKETFFCMAIDLPAHGKSPYKNDILASIERTIKPLKKPILVGYSLGGRIAMQLSQQMDLTGMIAISSHTGLGSPQQKKRRLQEDLLWKKRLETLAAEEFLSLWYSQAVFSSLQKKQSLLSALLSQRTYTNGSELALVLLEMSLAKQALLDSFNCPSYFIFGEDDDRYATLYNSLPKNIPRSGISNAGHTLLVEDPIRCATLIKNWITEIHCKQYPPEADTLLPE